MTASSAGPDGLTFELSTTVLDAPDARALAAFYRDLLGWQTMADEPDWVMLRPADGGTGLSFQSEPAFVRPTWPSSTEHQQMQMHLDVYVSDMVAGTAKALALGAQLADWQPQEDVRVLLDPVGHPFCLFES